MDDLMRGYGRGVESARLFCDRRYRESRGRVFPSGGRRVRSAFHAYSRYSTRKAQGPRLMSLTPLPPLGCLLAFEASARHLSFTRAGIELHLSPSAVSRQISQLEEFLG